MRRRHRRPTEAERALLALALCACAFLATVLACTLLPQSDEVVASGGRLTDDALEGRAVLLMTGDDAFELVLPRDVDVGELSLVVTDSRSFRLYVNGTCTYSYQGTPASHRVHGIALPALGRGVVTLRYETDFSSSGAMFLLTATSLFERDMRAALAFNFLVIGACLAIALHALVLHVRKRSETYLLYLLALASSAVLTTVLYMNYPLSGLPLWDVLHMGYLHALSQALCLAFCLRITHPNLRGGVGLAILVGVELTCALLDQLSYAARTAFVESLSLVAAGVLVHAASKRRPYARVMLTGAAMTGGMYGFWFLLRCGALQPPPVLFYVHLPEVAYLVFVLFGTFVVDGIFAGKFSQADMLVRELELANARLDDTVALRTADLTKTARDLRDEQARKHAMMTNIFHDLRSPLFGASGYARMVHGATPQDERHLETLRDQLAHLTSLTESLFLVAKLEERQISFAEAPVDVVGLCRDVADESIPAAARKGMSLAVEAPEGDGPVVVGDGFRLRQALENLVSNAIAHCPDGTSAGIRVSSDGGDVRIAVWDDGPGIARDDLPHVFERYYTGAHRGRGAGTGLGLHISQELARAQGGRVEVESEPGRGSTFTIVMPSRAPGMAPTPTQKDVPCGLVS